MPLFEQVGVPVDLIHGDADSLVPYDNSPFIKGKLPVAASLFTLEGHDHPLQMQAPDYLVQFVLDVFNNGPDPKNEELIGK